MLDENKISDKPLTRSEQKRLSVLDAAKTTFLAKGYGSVSMDTIAEKAGVSKRTVYSHFGSKAELFGGIMYATCAIKQAELISTIDPQKSIQNVLTEMGRTFLTFMFDPETISLLRILIGNIDHLPGLGENFFEGGPTVTVAALSQYFQEVEKTGLVKFEDPFEAASGFMGSLLGHRQIKALATNLPLPNEEEIERMVQGAVDRFLNGVLVR